VAQPAGVFVEVDAGRLASRHAQAEVKLQHALARSSGGGEEARRVHRQDVLDEPLLRGSRPLELRHVPVLRQGSGFAVRQDYGLDGGEALAHVQVVEVRGVPVQRLEVGNADPPAEPGGGLLHGLHARIPRHALPLRPAVVVGAEDELRAWVAGQPRLAGGDDVAAVHRAEDGHARGHVEASSRGEALVHQHGGEVAVPVADEGVAPLLGEAPRKLLGAVPADALDALHAAGRAVEGDEKVSLRVLPDEAERRDAFLLKVGMVRVGGLRGVVVGLRLRYGLRVGGLPFGLAPRLRLLHPAASGLHLLLRDGAGRGSAPEPLVGSGDLDHVAGLPA